MGKRVASTAPLEVTHCRDEPTRGDLSCRGKGEWWASAQLPQLCRTLLEKPTSFQQHPEYWGGTSIREDQERQMRISKGVKGTRFSWTALSNAAGSLPMSLWDPHLRISPLCLQMTPSAPSVKPLLLPTLHSAPCVCSWVQWPEWGPVNGVLSEDLSRVGGQGRNHKLEQ